MSEGVERHLEVTRTARFWTLGAPGRRPREVWFVLHGYGQLARRFLRRFAPLDDGARWVVAPEALSRFYAEATPGRHGPGSVVGATWMTREDRLNEIADYVAYLDRLADTVLGDVPADEGTDAPRVVVLGFSQGVATAARWTVLGRVRPARLVLWGDWVPPDLPLDAAARRWEGVDVVRVRGDDDPIFRRAGAGAEEDERLAAAGIEARVVTYPGGHDIHAETLQSLAASET